MGVKIVNAVWFSQSNTTDAVGIVFAIDEITKEPKVYIGIGNGISEELDSKTIASFGSKLSRGVASEILEFLNSKK